MFCKKGVLENFTKFTGKLLYQSLYFNKLAGLRPAILLKKETLAQMYFYEFCETFKNTFFIEHHRWLILDNYLSEMFNFLSEQENGSVEICSWLLKLSWRTVSQKILFLIGCYHAPFKFYRNKNEEYPSKTAKSRFPFYRVFLYWD